MYENSSRHSLPRPFDLSGSYPASWDGPWDDVALGDASAISIDPAAGGPAADGSTAEGPATGPEYHLYHLLPNRQNGEQENKCENGKVTGGIDWLKASGEMRCDPDEWERLRPALEAGQACARLRGQKDWDPAGMVVERGPVKFLVQRSGLKVGPQGCIVRCKWVLVSRFGIAIGIADEPEHLGEPGANIVIEASGDVCLRLGGNLVAILQEVGAMLNLLGFRGDVWEFRPHRVDFAVDKAGTRVEDFVELKQAGCVVSRPGKGSVHDDHGKVTGFTIGDRNRFRAYDKLLEVRKKGDDDIWERMCRDRWGCDPRTGPESATRFEYQLTGQMLRSLGVRCLGDLREKQGDVAHYLVNDWVRFTASAPDRENRHQNRAIVHPVWEGVCRGVLGVFGEAPPAKRESRRVSVDTYRHRRQIAGHLSSLLAAAGVDGESVECLRLRAEAELRAMVRKLFVRPKLVPVVRGEDEDEAAFRKRASRQRARPQSESERFLARYAEKLERMETLYPQRSERAMSVGGSRFGEVVVREVACLAEPGSYQLVFT